VGVVRGKRNCLKRNGGRNVSERGVREEEDNENKGKLKKEGRRCI
jgi:hypothetical protein